MGLAYNACCARVYGRLSYNSFSFKYSASIIISR